MPTATNRIEELREQAGENEIPYLSKSRVKSWETCPRKFYHTYIEGRRAEETFAMKQGTRVHEVFEDYYANILEVYGGDGKGETPFPPTPEFLSTLLPDDVLRWADWRIFMANFLVWECQRAQNALEYIEDITEYQDANILENEIHESAIQEWLPVGIEAEEWKDDEDPPWMGFADVVVHSSSVAEIDSNNGVVIVDFKTGKTPNEKYRDKGIFLEGEYYGMIFEQDMDISGVAGFYPKAGDFLVSDLSNKRRKDVEQIISEINEAVEGGCDIEDFPIDEQPLCMWSSDPDDRCDFYDECPSTWGVPAEKKELFEQMVENGNSAYQIADYMDTEVPYVYYWAKKFNLEL